MSCNKAGFQFTAEIQVAFCLPVQTHGQKGTNPCELKGKAKKLGGETVIQQNRH